MILKTIHGSHLYGLAHATSDIDVYTVFEAGKVRQKITTLPNGVEYDNIVFNLETYIKMLHKGVPQAIEALFSPVASWSEEWEPFFSNFRINAYRAHETYRSTIASQIGLYHQEMELGRIEKANKKLRHGLRLMMNEQELLDKGYFNPALTANQKRFIRSSIATNEAEKIIAQYLQ